MSEDNKIIATAEMKAEFHITFVLSKSEAKALDAIAGYGTEPFLKVFYEKMGQSYLKPHEKGLVSLFSRIMKELPKEVKKIEEAQSALKDIYDKFK